MEDKYEESENFRQQIRKFAIKKRNLKERDFFCIHHEERNTYRIPLKITFPLERTNFLTQ